MVVPEIHLLHLLRGTAGLQNGKPLFLRQSLVDVDDMKIRAHTEDQKPFLPPDQLKMRDYTATPFSVRISHPVKMSSRSTRNMTDISTAALKYIK